MGDILQLVKIKKFYFSKVKKKISRCNYFVLSRREAVDFGEHPFNKIKEHIMSVFSESPPLKPYFNFNFEPILSEYDNWLIELKLFDIDSNKEINITPEYGFFFCVLVINMSSFGIISNVKRVLSFIAENKIGNIHFYPVFFEEATEDKLKELKKFVKDYFNDEHIFYCLPNIKEEEEHEFKRFFAKTNLPENYSAIYDDTGHVRFVGSSQFITDRFLEMILTISSKEKYKTDQKFLKDLEKNPGILMESECSLKKVSKYDDKGEKIFNTYQNLYFKMLERDKKLVEVINPSAENFIFYTSLSKISSLDIKNKVSQFLEYEIGGINDFSVRIKKKKLNFKKPLLEIEITLRTKPENEDSLIDQLNTIDKQLYKLYPFLPPVTTISALPYPGTVFEKDFTFYQMDSDTKKEFSLSTESPTILILFGEMNDQHKIYNFSKVLEDLHEVLDENQDKINVKIQLVNDFYGYYTSGKFNYLAFFKDKSMKIVQTKFEKESNLLIHLKSHRNYYYFLIFDQSKMLRYIGKLEDIDVKQTLLNISHISCYSGCKGKCKCQLSVIFKEGLLKSSEEKKKIKSSFNDLLSLLSQDPNHQNYRKYLHLSYSKQFNFTSENEQFQMIYFDFRITGKLKKFEEEKIKKEIQQFKKTIGERRVNIEWIDTYTIKFTDDCFICQKEINDKDIFFIHPEKKLSICVECESRFNNGQTKVSSTNLVYVKIAKHYCIKEVVKSLYAHNLKATSKVESLSHSSCSNCNTYIRSGNFCYINLLEISSKSLLNFPELICSKCFNLAQLPESSLNIEELELYQRLEIDRENIVVKKIWLGPKSLLCEPQKRENNQVEEVYVKRRTQKYIKWGSNPEKDVEISIVEYVKNINQLLETYKCENHLGLLLTKTYKTSKSDFDEGFEEIHKKWGLNLVKSKFDFTWEDEPYKSLKAEIFKLINKKFDLFGFVFKEKINYFDQAVTLFPLHLFNCVTKKEEEIHFTGEDIAFVSIESNYHIAQQLLSIPSSSIKLETYFVFSSEETFKNSKITSKDIQDKNVLYQGENKTPLLQGEYFIVLDSNCRVRTKYSLKYFTIEQFLKRGLIRDNEEWSADIKRLKSLIEEPQKDLEKESLTISLTKVKLFNSMGHELKVRNIPNIYGDENYLDRIFQENSLPFKDFNYFPFSEKFKSASTTLSNYTFWKSKTKQEISCKLLYEKVLKFCGSSYDNVNIMLTLDDNQYKLVEEILKDVAYNTGQYSYSSIFAVPKEETSYLNNSLNLSELKIGNDFKVSFPNLKKKTLSLSAKTLKLLFLSTIYEEGYLEFLSNHLEEFNSKLGQISDYENHLKVFKVLIYNQDKKEFNFSESQRELFSHFEFSAKIDQFKELKIHFPPETKNLSLLMILNSENQVRFVGDVNQIDFLALEESLSDSSDQSIHMNKFPLINPSDSKNNKQTLVHLFRNLQKALEIKGIYPYINYVFKIRMKKSKSLGSGKKIGLPFQISVSIVIKHSSINNILDQPEYVELIEFLEKNQFKHNIIEIESYSLSDNKKCKKCSTIIGHKVPHYINLKGNFSICLYCERFLNNEKLHILSHDSIIFVNYSSDDQLDHVTNFYINQLNEINLSKEEFRQIRSSSCKLCLGELKSNGFIYLDLLNSNTKRVAFYCSDCFKVLSKNVSFLTAGLDAGLMNMLDRKLGGRKCLVLKKIFYNY